VTHHLTILSFRANYERLSPEEFIRLDEHEKPVNCGITVYRGDPNQGKDGKLVLQIYNKKFY
jgi:IS5 family transposase